MPSRPYRPADVAHGGLGHRRLRHRPTLDPQLELLRKAFWTKRLAIAPPFSFAPREALWARWAASLQGYVLLDQPEGQMVRYPQIRVELRTRNPLVLVAAVRQELRRAGVDKDEIQRFSEEALAGRDLQKAREVCETWVATGHRGE